MCSSDLEPDFLQALVANQKNPGKIWSLFEQSGLDAARLSTINPAPDPVTPYSRVVLSGTPECEIMLARWAARVGFVR